MEKVMRLLVIIVFVTLFSSCVTKGPAGPTGPAGPQTPGLNYTRVFQQGVYSSTYSGQVQAELCTWTSGTTYTSNLNPLGVGAKVTDGSDDYRTIIKFNLESLPSTKIIVDKAELTLHTTSLSMGGGADNMEIHKVIAPWTIYFARWGSASSGVPWTNDGGDFSAATMTANAAFYDIAADSEYTIGLAPEVVQDWMENPATNYGMFLKVQDELKINFAQFYSSGAVLPSNRPMLKIWYYTIE